MARLAPFAVVLVAGCTCACEPQWDAMDPLFCDVDEACFDGVGGNEPGFMCGQDICSDVVIDGECVAEFTCNQGKCKAVSLKPGYSENPCVLSHCDDGQWQSEPVDVDDGDPCTLDQCDPTTGQITHTNQC